jgi:hypothetical protein
MPKNYVVPWRDDQRELLYALLQKGHAPARTVRRAHTLLLADEPPPVQTMAAMWHASAVPVTHTCKRWLHAGLETALYDRPRPGSRRKLEGRQEAHLGPWPVARPPPDGSGGACGSSPIAWWREALSKSFPLPRAGGG